VWTVKITAVGEGLSTAGATMVDGGGQYVMPQQAALTPHPHATAFMGTVAVDDFFHWHSGWIGRRHHVDHRLCHSQPLPSLMDLPTVAQLGRKSAADYGHVAITWWDESVSDMARWFSKKAEQLQAFMAYKNAIMCDETLVNSFKRSLNWAPC
jgi:dihydroorotase-like cyclic amidohydrolase